ncbi:MAG: hypothetical protein HKN31_12460 [Pricia sp.]|nr:hypothetical protein [Pricia sp.]
MRKASIVLIAVLLGVSNAMLEEDRTLTDTSMYVKKSELPSDDDPLADR